MSNCIAGFEKDTFQQSVARDSLFFKPLIVCHLQIAASATYAGML
jgi:hypothetical protein